MLITSSINNSTRHSHPKGKAKSFLMSFIITGYTINSNGDGGGGGGGF